jgi:NAD(P)-dependent dehydrogenase (short-subunit alcohol dehydrogenase family)
MANETAFITGAATGIGRALARKLDGVGWTVFAGVHETPPDELLRGASDRLTAVRVNIANAAEVANAAMTARDAVGEAGLGLLINNAAMTAAPGAVECLDLDRFKELMEVNFWGQLRMVQAFLPLLRRHGAARIIMVTSASVYLTIPLNCSYPASKQALKAVAQHLRMELAPFGIEVTNLEPGGVATPMTAQPPEEEATFWEAFPPHLREGYAAAFAYPGAPIAGRFEFEPPEDFADAVYRKIICARKLKPRYTLGKGVGTLPVLQRLLPDSAFQAIWRRLFRANPTAGV